MRCPYCWSEDVQTTVHVVFTRRGRYVEPDYELTTVEAVCNHCERDVEDEETEGLVRDQYPDLFTKGE